MLKVLANICLWECWPLLLSQSDCHWLGTISSMSSSTLKLEISLGLRSALSIRLFAKDLDLLTFLMFSLRHKAFLVPLPIFGNNFHVTCIFPRYDWLPGTEPHHVDVRL